MAIFNNSPPLAIVNLMDIVYCPRLRDRPPQNTAAFAKAENQYGEKGYLQVCMVCLMELSSHLLRTSVMDRYDANEMRLAAGRMKQVSDTA